MKKNYILSITIVLLFSLSSIGQTLNGLCETSLPFCTGITYNYPAGVNTGSGQTGPSYACLGSEPNPAWYYLQIDQPGEISIEIHTVPQHDVDFICWGPFNSQTGPCTAQLTGSGSTHHVAGAGGGYPSGNVIDCSYDASWQEWCYIPNAQPGEYYIFLITNYSNQPCNIIFNQINTGQVGAGITSCGPAATVSGNFYFDSNNNGTKDVTEPGLYGGLAYAPTCGFYTQSDTAGNYNAYICATPDTIWSFYNHSYTIITPQYYELTGSTSTADFGVTFTQNVIDVSTILTECIPARPGFDYNVFATISNVGTDSSCGTLTISFDTIFDYISANPPADVITGNTLTWNNVCLPVFSTNNYTISLFLDSTTALLTPYVLSANFVTNSLDSSIVNNSDTISNIVVGSFDPNDKQVTPSGEITNIAAANEQELEYTIRFQNTGTYQATNITILDTLSSWLQVPSLTLLSSSHPCTYNISGHGKVQFIFNNINLPDANTNESGSHGFVKFKVKCKPSLANGGNVYNTANIYFDYNLPIVTNTTLTFTKVITTNIPSIKKQVTKSISVQPNPAIDIVTVNFDYAGKEALNIEIINNLGKTVQKQLVLNNQKTVNLNVSNLSAGTYTVRISGKNYSVNEMLIKQ
ncbi:MAG: T9SS type A sorting domain-containing protein [Bacteroidia bacterium]|nr:T9SS type A sorting domain-containing protein [Bacteroidia bacterium]